MSTAPHHRVAGAPGRRPSAPDALWAAVLVVVGFAEHSPLLPGADLALAWPTAGLVVLWAARHACWRSRSAVLLAASVLDGLTALASGGSTGTALVGAAALLAASAATSAALDGLVPDRSGGARTRDAGALVLACAAGALTGTLVELGLGTPGSDSAAVVLQEVVRALASAFVPLAAAQRLPRLVGAGAPDDASLEGGARALDDRGAPPLEVWAVWVLGLGVLLLVFVGLDGVPVAFAAFPVAVWAALRLPGRWTSAHLLASTALVGVGTVLGRGPFAAQDGAGAVVMANACASALALVGLVVALHRLERATSARRLDAALTRASDHAALLDAVHTAVSQGIVIYAADGSLLLANPAARTMLGENPREGSPRSWEGVYELRATDGSPLAAADAPVSRALAGQRVSGTDLVVSGPGSPGPRVLRVDAQPLPQVDGAAWSGGAVVVFQDVTEERAEAAAAAQARDLLAGVLDGATTQGIVATDAEHRITVFSSGAERLLGWAAAEVVGGSPLRFVRHAEVHERATALGVPPGAPVLLAGLAEGGHTTRRWTMVRRDGSTFTGEVTLTQTHDDDGALRSTTAVITDVTAEVAADQRRAEAELQFRLAFETAPTGMLLMSLEPGDLGRLTRVNEAFAAFTGRTSAELVAGRVRDLLHPEDAAGHVERLERVARERSTETASREQRFVRPDGSVRWGRTTPSLVEPADGGLPHLLVVVEDVTETRRAQAALVHAALHDPLTGLPNRAMLARRLEDSLRADARLLAGVTVLYVDLDGFKPVNDEHGHAAGDELLRVVAARLQRTVRGTDLVARLGGDEFALLCPGLAAEDVPDLLARVDAAVTAPVPLPSGAVVRVSASAGTASAVGDDDAQRLLDEADHSMYAVKRQRRRATGGTGRAAGRETRPRGAGRLPG